MKRDEARVYAQALAGGRAALGLAFFLLPKVGSGLWTGDTKTPAVRVLSRALGARDMALGLGALLALRSNSPVRGWLEAGGFADAGDALATIVAWKQLPRARRWLVIIAAAGAAALAGVLAPAVDS
jgi:hypothetical protein